MRWAFPVRRPRSLRDRTRRRAARRAHGPSPHRRRGRYPRGCEVPPRALRLVPRRRRRPRRPLGRPATSSLGGDGLVIVAAIDIGTNTTRLLIRDGDRTLVRTEVITRLGEGVDRTRRLQEAAISRTLKTLSDYRALLDTHRVGRVRAVATSPSRAAPNARDFL